MAFVKLREGFAKWPQGRSDGATEAQNAGSLEEVAARLFKATGTEGRNPVSAQVQESARHGVESRTRHIHPSERDSVRGASPGRADGRPTGPVKLRQDDLPKTLNDGVVLLAGTTVQDPQAAERFRILRAKVERHNLGSHPCNVIGVTSAVPAEGKTVVSVNFARALAMDPRARVIVIDCDLRKPTVQKYFKLPHQYGISDVLIRNRPWREVVCSVEPGLDVLSAGSPVRDAALTVSLPGFEALLSELARFYRYIIIDTPPVLLCPEPITVSPYFDGMVMVVEAWRTQKKLVRDAVQLIGKDKFLGVVFNRAEDSLNEYGYYGYYDYAYRQHGNGARKPEASHPMNKVAAASLIACRLLGRTASFGIRKALALRSARR